MFLLGGEHCLMAARQANRNLNDIFEPWMTEQHRSDSNRRGLIHEFPKPHLALASIAVGAIFVALMLPSGQVQAKRGAMPLPANPEWNTRAELLTQTEIHLDEPSLAETQSEQSWQELTVRKGDNLAKIFERAGVSSAQMQEVLELGAEADSLKRIFPGQKFSFQLNSNGELQALRYEEDLLNSTEIHRNDNTFVAEKVTREPDTQQHFAAGTIRSSLYKAAKDAGLSDGQILEMAKIFGSEIDFALDLRAGDSFMVMYEDQYLEGRKVGRGPILAASFTNQGETFSAFRYAYADGSVNYFTAAGVSMRKAFMRAPLDFLKVTSNFNMRRFHPVLKVTRPHRGIDYSAPTGTPVYAAGDGRVVQSGYSPSNGNFVVIQHSNDITTKYLHLSRRGAKVGTRVKQGQVIGAVGSTGYATGAHLHYEFLVKGVHRDPRSIPKLLPKAVALAGAEKARFQQQTSVLQQQFAALSANTQTKLAAADTAVPADKL
jgi:murein DD-endopeptidase MepM/ murein hydrolase activator NlpD